MLLLNIQVALSIIKNSCNGCYHVPVSSLRVNITTPWTFFLPPRSTLHQARSSWRVSVHSSTFPPGWPSIARKATALPSVLDCHTFWPTTEARDER